MRGSLTKRENAFAVRPNSRSGAAAGPRGYSLMRTDGSRQSPVSWQVHESRSTTYVTFWSTREPQNPWRIASGTFRDPRCPIDQGELLLPGNHQQVLQSTIINIRGFDPCNFNAESAESQLSGFNMDSREMAIGSALLIGNGQSGDARQPSPAAVDGPPSRAASSPVTTLRMVYCGLRLTFKCSRPMYSPMTPRAKSCTSPRNMTAMIVEA